jgi:AcrR family transcriptional regulator
MVQRVSLKQKQREDREQLILDYANKILLEKGYYDVSMEEIAIGVGIAKGTLYLHFPKKEDLVYGVVKPKMHSFLNSVEQAKSLSDSPKKKLEFLLQRELSGAFFQFLLKSSTNITTVFKSYKTEINEILSKIFDGIHEILKEGQRVGLFDTDLPIEFMSSAFINLFEPHLYQETVVARKMPVEVYIRHTTNLFFKGILNPKEME